MTDANQVRINELARELEVKAKAIIALLPGFGVTEKKTHSSSIPVDVAEKVRSAIQGQAQADAAAESAAVSEKQARDAAAKAARQRLSFAPATGGDEAPNRRGKSSPSASCCCSGRCCTTRRASRPGPRCRTRGSCATNC